MRASEALAPALSKVEALEHTVRAFSYLDPDRARAEAIASDARPRGALSGVVLGVKDIFDTFDQPTECGSPIYEGRRPRSDAAVVAMLREAGAICIGKTVTAEFACSHPGATTNPHRPSHTPGGSSMGSAAAVATAMVDLAIGTQTAASIIRPASFCGVFGYKPTYGTVSMAGVKPVAPSLDTVGFFARAPHMLDLARVAVTGRRPFVPLERPPRVALIRTDQWEWCDDSSRNTVEQATASFAASGALIGEVGLPDQLVGLAGEHLTVMVYEAARSLALEHRRYRSMLSKELVDLLDAGWEVDPDAYDTTLQRASSARARFGELFDDVDVILTPAVVGEAPEGLASTGDPRCGRLWTLLGAPCVSMPFGVGDTGLPVGVQLVGPNGGDAALLAAVSWLSDRIPCAPHQ